MGKCSRCGRGGLFRKLDKELGVCIDCAAAERAQRNFEKFNAQLAEVQRELTAKEAKRDELAAKNAEAQEALNKLLKRTEKLKPIAKSIQAANETWVGGEAADSETIARIAAMNIDELLPDPDLQCLTMRDLRSKYKALRSQISALCKSYERRYTTKSNAVMYKLMVLAMEAELETVLYKLQYGRLEVGQDAVHRLCERYYAICAEGNQAIAPTMKKFIGQMESLYLDVVATEYEYYVQRERAKEEQRALREQMRQEAEERKALEAEKKKVEAEERKYRQEIDRIELEAKVATGDELEALRRRIAELTAMMAKVEDRKAEIINLQNGKAGTVYVISNIGSFGENVFKVGMTRRLEPQDRINELSNASVPFPFDVHSFIFSEDAPALENALHKELNDRRVNKVNLRKEFFHVSVDEIQRMVERHDPAAAFRTTALAEQYRQSQSIATVPDQIPMEDVEDEFDDDDIA